MLYLAHRPRAPLSRFVRLLWYARGSQLDHRRERILPSGSAQVILSLARDFLLDCAEGLPAQRTAPALIVGQRSTYEIIDTSDFADLIGVVFEPGVLPAFVADRADLFSNQSISLGQIWGEGEAQALRDRLREISTPSGRILHLERFLLANWMPRIDNSRFAIHPAVEFGLLEFGKAPRIASVGEVARNTGWSDRRFSQLFREHVGFAPKTWCRISRFQRAVQQLRAGLPLRLSALAIDCGFYDQAHFADEFRAFSGIDISTYTTRRTCLWANHVLAD